jgi:hypothetical protein
METTKQAKYVQLPTGGLVWTKRRKCRFLQDEIHIGWLRTGAIRIFPGFNFGHASASSPAGNSTERTSMCDAKQMLEMAARLRKQAAETSLLTYAGLMLRAARDLENGAQIADSLPAQGLHPRVKDLS